MKRKILGLFFTVIIFFTSSCSDNSVDDPKVETKKISAPIEPYYPIPSKAQLEWQNSELIMFVVYGMNTYTGFEWGNGNEDPKSFNPTSLNVEQWVDIAKEVGFNYAILTAKHHDGFCLWPSQFTNQSIQNSPYKNGKGDIVKEFSDACQNKGVKFCFYLSPWDLHESTYGSDEYNTYFQNQLIELTTHYGETGEIWFDGAHEEGGTHQNYNWDLFFSTVRYFQPNALMSIMGPDIKWTGNEEGLANETEWSTSPVTSNFQNNYATSLCWYPSECNVSIRPGWYYHASEDNQLKSVEQLIDIYFKSVGRNSNLLLSVPPNKEGVISDVDIQRLREWKKRLDEIFANDLFQGQKIECSDTRNFNDYAPGNCLDDNRGTFWTTKKNIDTAKITISLPQKQNLNIMRLEEAIDFGQRVKLFEVYCDNNGTMEKVFQGTTIGRSRIIKFSAVLTDKIVIEIRDSYASPTIRTIKGFYSNTF